MSFPRHKGYHASGLSWADEIPVHWDVRRLKTLFTRVARPPREQDKIVTAFRDGQVTLRENRRQEGFTYAAQEVGYQGIRRGDLVIHAMDGFAGAIGVAEADGKSTPVYAACVAGSLADASYYALLLRHMALSGFVTALARGIRERSTEFRWADASVLPLPHPPLVEQRAIVAFLTYETAKIDALVEKQRRLIELLKEKRQAVISRAVTKGLDSSAAMTNSGVEWLGDVPKHWEVVPLRTLFRFIKRQDQAELDVLSVFRDYGVIRKGDREDNINQTPEDLSAYQTVQPGDLVVNKMKAWQGSLGVSRLTGITSPDYAVFRPTHKAVDAYLNFLLRCNLLPEVYRSISNGIRPDQWRLEPGRFKELKIPLPPNSEQLAIAETIERALSNFNGLAAAAAAAVELLAERRAALISAAVTGKIDVRELVPEAEAA